jgi:hypothetical protein
MGVSVDMGCGVSAAIVAVGVSEGVFVSVRVGEICVAAGGWGAKELQARVAMKMTPIKKKHFLQYVSAGILSSCDKGGEGILPFLPDAD